MPLFVKALPRLAESLLAAKIAPSYASETPPVEPTAEPVTEPLDFEGTATLSEAALRTQASTSDHPGARLAACWRLMIRDQALPRSAPTEGIRLLTLMNLATQQDLELLEVLVCLDPSSAVRAQAATLIWRVARDRDRVVDLLVSRLQRDLSLEVLVHLLTLVPSLPFEKTRSMARSHMDHPSIDVRRASRDHWLQNGGEPDNLPPLERTSDGCDDDYDDDDYDDDDYDYDEVE